MMSDNQSAKRKRKRSIKDSSCNENSTNNFKESLEPSWNFVNVFLDDGRKRLTRGMLQKLKEQNVADLTNRNSLLSDSVIILNNTVEQPIVDEEAISKDDHDVSIIECSSKPSLPLQKTSPPKKLQNFLNKKKNRSSVILINNDSSDGHSTDVQQTSVHESIHSLSNEENIAPHTEDEIVELWSNLKTNNNKRKKDAFKKQESCKMNNDVCFVIDTKPDPKNLDCLKINLEPANKKRKLHHINDEAVAYNPSKDLKQGRKTKHHKKSHKKEKKKKCSEKRKEEKKVVHIVSSSYTNLLWNPSSTSNPTSTSDSSPTSTSDSNPTSTSDPNPNSNKLREIIVDGSNVARAYTHDKGFAEKGIQLIVDYFMTRGHAVKVFLPLHARRKRYLFLEEMYKKGIVVFTPSRKVLGRQITPYDDRYILEYATSCNGIVISADQYRDLYKERPEWRDTIVNRLLTPTFVGDFVMFPEDPLGRFGPNLHTFLRH